MFLTALERFPHAATTAATDLFHSSERRNSLSRGGSGRESESILSALHFLCFCFLLMIHAFFWFRVESKNTRPLSLNSTTQSSTSMIAIDENSGKKRNFSH
jgi:hypothetical protein